MQPKAYILLSGERKGKGKTEKKENSKERRGKEATINNEFKVHLSNKQIAIQKDTKRMTKYQLLKHSMWTHYPSHLFRRYLLAEKGLYYSKVTLLLFSRIRSNRLFSVSIPN